jgi:hypothetical protein
MPSQQQVKVVMRDARAQLVRAGSAYGRSVRALQRTRERTKTFRQQQHLRERIFTMDPDQ